jgi:outer membrane protein TolC
MLQLPASRYPLFALAIAALLLAPAGSRADEAPSPGADPVAALSGSDEGTAITPELLDRLVNEARAHSPGLQAAAARMAAAGAAVAAVRTWEDPTATVGFTKPTPRGLMASQDGNLMYEVDQKLPLYGKPDLIRRQAAADASREQYAADFEAQKLRRDLGVALIQLALGDLEVDFARRDLAWLAATSSSVDHLYRVGGARQVDWLKVETAQAVAGDALRTSTIERAHGAVALNRMLNRDLHAAWPRFAVPAVLPDIPYTPRLVEAALAAEPELRIMRQESVSAEAAADLTRRQRLPDVSVGLQAWQYTGDAGIREGTVTVSFSVPWLNRGKYDDDWRRDRQRQRASELAADDYALSVREELHHHIDSLDAARREAALYRDQVIPLTRQTLASAEAAWDQNLGPFQDVLDAHRMLVSGQLSLAQARADQATMIVEIALLTGARDAEGLLALAGDASPGGEGRAPDSNK